MSLVIHHPISIVNRSTKYTTPYQWESRFDFVSARQLVSSTRNPIICLAIFYVLAIFSIQRYMKERPAFKLRNVLVIWNSTLAVLTTIAFWRILPEFATQLLRVNGFHDLVCKWNSHNIVTAYWFHLLLWTKILELGDTIFIVLRKQKLIFLHWFHHGSVVVASWIFYETYEPRTLWFVGVNSGVHSIVYFYYTMKALGLKVPRQFSMLITTTQLLEMFMGIFVNLYGFSILMSESAGGNTKCGVSPLTLSIGSALYTPYFVLFAKFFYGSYFSRSGKQKKDLVKIDKRAASGSSSR